MVETIEEKLEIFAEVTFPQEVKTKQKVFIINGFPGVGKDYLINELAKLLPDFDVHSVSTVDKIKQMASVLGYSDSSKEQFRQYLSDSKDLVDKAFPNWTLLNCVKRTCIALDNSFLGNKRSAAVFIHSRTPSDIDFIKESLDDAGYEAITLLVEADWYKRTEFTNHADKDVMNYAYNYTFKNSKKEKTFNKNIKQFISEHNLI